MLKLERMQLSGFKSFSDRTEVRFPGGITAIVGPNGCGKSNIGDAINWVLGEQSAKMLRGKHMSDVIFNGSRSRKPQGLAEVSLRFSGAEGIAGNDQGTIAITRRLFRSGESEYLLNGARARLKDIQEILRQARVGTKTYATIEQGKIDQVLNAKPKDRRLMIEDAAGVAGYKHKRRLTELKLEATLANLLRVNDIVSEVRRQINTLKRQAAKARRYRKLREEYRSRETLRFALRTRSLEQDLERARESEAQLRDGEAGAAGELARQEVSIAEERAALDEAVRAHRELAERLHQIEIEIDRKESQIHACRERIGESEHSSSRKTDESEQLASRLEELKSRQQEHRKQVVDGRAEVERLSRELAEHQAELDRVQGTLKQQNEEIENLRSRQFDAVTGAADLKNRKHRIEESIARQQQQRERLADEQVGVLTDWTRLEGESTRLLETIQEQAMRREVAQAGFDKSEQQLREARALQVDETERLTEARESEKAAQTKLHTLEDVETRFAGVSDGVRALLADGSTAGVGTLGVVADFIDARADIEIAAEGYLRSILPAVIVEDDHAVERAADFLRDSQAGGASFISRTQPVGGLAVGSPQNGSGPVPQAILDDQRVLGRLRDRVHLKSSVNGVVQNRIGDAVLVDTLRSGLELHRLHPAADYLTLEGDVVHASGVVTVAGSADAGKGLLAHKRRVEEADSDVRDAAERSARVHETVVVSRRHVEQLEIEVQEQRQALDESSRRGLEVELQSQKVAEERDRIGRRRDVLADEIAMLDEDVARLALERFEASSELLRAEESRQGVQSALELRTAVSGEGQDRVQQLAEAVATLRAEQAARGERQQGIEQEQERLALEAGELASRVESLRSEVAQAKRSGARTDAHRVGPHAPRRSLRPGAGLDGQRGARRRLGRIRGNGRRRDRGARAGDRRDQGQARTDRSGQHDRDRGVLRARRTLRVPVGAARRPGSFDELDEGIDSPYQSPVT